MSRWRLRLPTRAVEAYLGGMVRETLSFEDDTITQMVQTCETFTEGKWQPPIASVAVFRPDGDDTGPRKSRRRACQSVMGPASPVCMAAAQTAPPKVCDDEI